MFSTQMANFVHIYIPVDLYESMPIAVLFCREPAVNVR